MKFPPEPKPVEVPGRVFCALSVLLFAWHQGTNGGKIDWISLILFLSTFLPWLGYIVESITIKDFSVKFPPAAGIAPSQPAAPSSSQSEFSRLSPSAKKILATLARYRKGHGDDWGFNVDPRNPYFINFQAGAYELAQKQLIRQASNGLFALTQEGLDFCNREDKEISKFDDLYSNFVPIQSKG